MGETKTQGNKLNASDSFQTSALISMLAAQKSESEFEIEYVSQAATEAATAARAAGRYGHGVGTPLARLRLVNVQCVFVFRKNEGGTRS